MAMELRECIMKLEENHTGAEIAGALGEYFQIVKSISEEYTDGATVGMLREDHPELDFMDQEELETALRQARMIRHKRGKEQPSRAQMPGRKPQLGKEIQAELDRRTEIEKQAVQAIADGDLARANELIFSLDDGTLRSLMRDFRKVSKGIRKTPRPLGSGSQGA